MIHVFLITLVIMAVFAKKTTVKVDTHVHVKRAIVVTIVSTVSFV